MIRTFGELLRELVAAERRVMDRQAVTHPGIIGDMYEGLARSVTERALLDVANLRVVEGLVRNSKGEQSRQIDVMVVDGEGERVPNTEHWIYPVSQVLAVVEVKKTLYGSELGDALDLMRDFSRRITEPRAMKENLLRDAWRSIHGTDLPSSEGVRRLAPTDEQLYSSLAVEANMPLRIILGFDGYRSEGALRTGLVDALTASKGMVGPVALPSLILARESSLIKLNGMPYGVPFVSSGGRWYFYGSRGAAPISVLLNMLWTRLTYYYGAPSSIFGEDLELDAINLLLIGRAVSKDGQQGWNVDVINLSEDELARGQDSRSWEPAILSKAAFVVMNQLCNDERVSLDEPELKVFAEREVGSLNALVEELLRSRLVYIDAERHMRLLTDACGCVIVPDVGFVAGENKSGRLERWVFRHMAARKSPPKPQK